jgi:hypothetical protein
MWNTQDMSNTIKYVGVGFGVFWLAADSMHEKFASPHTVEPCYPADEGPSTVVMLGAGPASSNNSASGNFWIQMNH